MCLTLHASHCTTPQLWIPRHFWKLWKTLFQECSKCNLTSNLILWQLCPGFLGVIDRLCSVLEVFYLIFLPVFSTYYHGSPLAYQFSKVSTNFKRTSYLRMLMKSSCLMQCQPMRVICDKMVYSMIWFGIETAIIMSQICLTVQKGTLLRMFHVQFELSHPWSCLIFFLYHIWPWWPFWIPVHNRFHKLERSYQKDVLNANWAQITMCISCWLNWSQWLSWFSYAKFTH